VRLSQRTPAGLLAGTLLAAGLTGGCSSVIRGTPVPAPGAKAAPGTEARPPVPSAKAPTQQQPAGVIPLPPDDNGYVFIETKSGHALCRIDAGNAGCQAQFTNSPIQDGEHANGVNVTAGGSVQWVLGNIGALSAVPIGYHTYSAEGWTIEAGEDGTRFTNDRTGRGMFVSIEHVDTF
jgi:hypothetical protein